MEELIQIGKLGKPRGVKGELRIFVKDQYENALFDAKHVFVESEGQKLPYFIESIKEADHLLVKFEDVNAKEDASSLSNALVFLPESSLLDVEEIDDVEAWIGFTISDEKIGVIGKITDLIEMKDQILAEINYQKKTILIPLHENLILDIEMDKKIILMDLPEGILEM